MVEILSGGGDTRSTSGAFVNVGCATNGFGVPPKIPAICNKVNFDCSPKPETDVQEIIRREIEKRFARLFGFEEPCSSTSWWWAPVQPITGT